MPAVGARKNVKVDLESNLEDYLYYLRSFLCLGLTKVAFHCFLQGQRVCLKQIKDFMVGVWLLPRFELPRGEMDAVYCLEP